VVFGYDGSELARAAIAEAGHQLPAHRDALVVTVWSMLNVEFVPEPGTHFDSACADEVRQAAEQTAALAKAAGFHAQAIAVEGTPTWKAIADTADNYDASLIVLACRGHRGLSGHLVGSVARDVAARSRRPVLIEREHRGASTFVPGRPRPAARGRPQ
jgi:nucleotide-binding universal stress UspA family protein